MDAARRYKARIAEVTEGLDARADENAARIAALRERVDTLDKALLAAGDRHLLTRLGAELAWEDALEVLWVETWIQMRPFPRPDPWAKAEHIALLSAQVEERAAELRAVVQRKRLSLPGH